MKRNFLIMMIMLLCSGFAFAQINTVRGFVPGAGTGAGNNDQTYAVFGQMFGNIDLNAANPYEVAEGLAQAQLIADTVEAVVGCGDSLKIGDFTLSTAAIDAIVAEFAADPTRPRDTFLTLQRTNAAIYNYDRLMVLHLFVCPCTIDDYNGNPYDVVAIDNICWTKTNMRATTTCGGIDVVTKSYSTDVTPELDPATFGLLYTWENASKDSKCDSNYVTGICPCGWHLPTAAEVDTILKSYTNDLRSNGGYWVVPEGITNLTKFTAEPAGYFDSLATRFEGFHSEADFWYVATDSTCNADYFQIYYFCDKPKHEPRNVNTDAMSVRCVLDMIYDYHKDDPTPNPNPNPQPSTSCATVGQAQVSPADYSFSASITGVNENTSAQVAYIATYVDLNSLDGTATVSGSTNINSFADNTITWQYPGSATYSEGDLISLVCTLTVMNGTQQCTSNLITIFDSEEFECDLHVGQININNNVATIEIENYNPDYFETISCWYTTLVGATEDCNYAIDPSPSNQNVSILSAVIPANAEFGASFKLKPAYASCAEEDQYYINRPQPTPTPTSDCPFNVSEVYQLGNNSYAVNVDNTDAFTGQEAWIIFYAGGNDQVGSSPLTLTTTTGTTTTYSVDAPTSFPQNATSYEIIFRFNLKTDYNACSNSNVGYYVRTREVDIPGTEPINPPVGDLCPSASFEAQSSNYIVFHVENLNFASEISISFGVYNDDSDNPLTTVNETISADAFDADGNYILDYDYTTSFSYLSGTFNVTPNTMISGCTDVQLPFSSVQN
jgi:uncharacterized protein (TIGR02145 family)